MTLPSFPVEGGCRCCRVRFRLSDAPWLESVCHCRGCQRMTASAFSTTITVGNAAFAVTAGETVIGGIHGDDAHHHHCDWCKTWVYTTPVRDQGFLNVRATLLDEPYWYMPWMEVQAAEKLPWVQLGAARSYERFPEMAEYEGLIARYRAERRR